MRSEGIADDLIYKPQELQTLTALEKGVGKKKLAAILGDLIEKPEGKPTLVEMSDKRPALNLTKEMADEFDDSLI